jgi:hypothetical protein
MEGLQRLSPFTSPTPLLMRFRLLSVAISGVLLASSACSNATAPLPMTAPESAAPSRGLAGGHRGNGDGSQAAVGSASYTVTTDSAKGNIAAAGRKQLSGYLVAE